MKLNHDCIRSLLLYLEDRLESIDEIDLSGVSDVSLEKFSKDDIIYSAIKLSEAGYISAKINTDICNNINIYIKAITWEGHKFLDTIRDNTVWSQTKNILSKVSSCSISFVSTIASQVLTNLINQHFSLN